MSLASLVGWLIVGVAIALGYCAASRRRQGQGETGSDGDPPCATDASEGPTAHEWCDAFEAISGACALLFDSTLRLIAMGRRAGGSVQARDGGHLIDIAPADAMLSLLDGAAAARRGEVRSWSCAWDGHEVEATMAPAGAQHIITLLRGTDAPGRGP